MRRLIGICAILVCIFISAIAIRCINYNHVLKEDRTNLFGPDSYCHMRRIQYSADHKLALPEPDPMLNYPEGARSYWGPLFDKTIASSIILLDLKDDIQRERFAAFAPAVLGGFCAIMAFLLGGLLVPCRQEEGRKTGRINGFNTTAGLITACIIAFLPGHATCSLLGRTDHHVMESLLAGLTWALFAMLQRQRSRRNFIIWSCACSAGIALMYAQHPAIPNLVIGAFWAGCVIQVADHKDTRIWWLPFVVSSVLMLAPAMYSIGLDPTGLTPAPHADLPKYLLVQQYSFFQPLLLLFFAILLVLAKTRLAAGKLKSPSAISLILLGLACACVLAIPLYKGFLVLVKADPLIRYTSESLPILSPSMIGGLSLAKAHAYYGYMFALFPVWWLFVSRRSSPMNGFLLPASALFFILILLQVRFTYLFSFAAGLAVAWSIQNAWFLRKKSLLKSIALLAVVLLSFHPSAVFLSSAFRKYSDPNLKQDIHNTMFEWMRNNTKPVAGFNDITQKPDYSVLAMWSRGHNIVYIAQRPVVSDPFNHGMEKSMGYFASTDPKEAVNILIDNDVRYIIPLNPESIYTQAYISLAMDLSVDHPLSKRQWYKLFYARLLHNLPISGPDSHPFAWGHTVVYSSGSISGGKTILKFDESRVIDFQPRAYYQSHQDKASGILATVGDSSITEIDIADWQRSRACIPGSDTSRKIAFMHQLKRVTLDNAFAKYSGMSKAAIKNTRNRGVIDSKSKPPKTMRCIEDSFGENIERYNELYLSPFIHERQSELARLLDSLAKKPILSSIRIPYRIHDDPLRAYVMEQSEPFLTLLRHYEDFENIRRPEVK
ncbi:hypothetical protein ACFL6Y_03650 [Elusimicrobiota bacterium]